MIVATILALALTHADRSAVIGRISELLNERYVYEDVAKRCSAEVRGKLLSGRYDSIDDAAAFAKAVTADLRADCDDRHLELAVRAEPASAPADPNAWKEDLRRRNYDFVTVRQLPGNVGYLDLRSFPPPEVAAQTAAGAMAFLAASDVVIIDLRQNSGGTGDMVLFLATYFFDRPTALSNTLRRAQNSSTQDRTLPWVPGSRLANTDLFVLTSATTFSAAEAFAFSLQSIGRATIVGEVTKGGANAGRYTDVSDQFRLFVPNAHATSAVTGKTWDKVGVKPDIAVAANSALKAAHAAAIQRLLAKTNDPGRRKDLESVRPVEVP